MKLKVLKMEDTPENCTRRVVLSHDDDCQDWVRDARDCVFMLWSNSRNHRGDTVYDTTLKKYVDVESPYEEILDEDGCGTDEYKLKPGIIAFPVDVYEHSGRAWALHGEGGPCFSCPRDTARNAFVLYVDEKRWTEFVGESPKWEFADGRPTDELYRRAREIARGEIEDMNLCEAGSYYGYKEEFLVKEDQRVVETGWDGSVKEEVDRHQEYWDDADGDSCWGFLTDKPARDVGFPIGCPVFTTDEYLVGDTFEQECFAFRDVESGKYLSVNYELGLPKHRLVDDPKFATLWNRRGFLETNRKSYEDDFKKALAVVDVTEEIWNNWPECKA